MIPELPPAFVNLGYALAAGLLIGLERGWTLRDGPQGSRVAGVRTFTLLGLSGGVSVLLPPILGAMLLAGLGLSLVVGYFLVARQPNRHSVTATIAALLTVGLGALATGGAPEIAVAGAATVTIVLASRQPLHHWLQGMSGPEIRAGARFAVIAFVLLPLAPDVAMGPYDAWNPHKLWLVVVFVSGLSFLGYLFHARAAGRRGVVVTALAAAVVSSTVATVSLARRLDAAPGSSIYGAAIVAANIVMLTRVLAIVGMFVPSILPHLAILLAPALGMSLLGSLIGLRHLNADASPEAEAGIPIGNPLDLGAAIGLALVVALASLGGHWVLAQFGDLALSVVLALIGMFDVDAAVFTIAGLPANRIAPLVAAGALAVPVLLNMLAKAALTLGFARHRAGLTPALWLGAGAALSGVMLLAVS